MSESWDLWELNGIYAEILRIYQGIYGKLCWYSEFFLGYHWNWYEFNKNSSNKLRFLKKMLVVEPPGKNNPRENELGYDDPWRSMFETTKHYGEFLEKKWEKLPRKKHGDLKNHPRNSPSLSRLSSSWTLCYRQIVRIGDWATGFLSVCWVPKLDMSIFWRRLPTLYLFSSSSPMLLSKV